ncbi:hypothetical protein ACLOJK_004758 [Asimina triloba]
MNPPSSRSDLSRFDPIIDHHRRPLEHFLLSFISLSVFACLTTTVSVIGKARISRSRPPIMQPPSRTSCTNRRCRCQSLPPRRHLPLARIDCPCLHVTTPPDAVADAVCNARDAPLPMMPAACVDPLLFHHDQRPRSSDPRQQH